MVESRPWSSFQKPIQLCCMSAVRLKRRAKLGPSTVMTCGFLVNMSCVKTFSVVLNVSV